MRAFSLRVIFSAKRRVLIRGLTRKFHAVFFRINGKHTHTHTHGKQQLSSHVSSGKSSILFYYKVVAVSACGDDSHGINKRSLLLNYNANLPIPKPVAHPLRFPGFCWMRCIFYFLLFQHMCLQWQRKLRTYALALSSKFHMRCLGKNWHILSFVPPELHRQKPTRERKHITLTYMDTIQSERFECV